MSLKRFPASLEYKKDPELSKEAIDQLLDWAHKQPHLPKIAEEDAILFLTSCIYSIEQAKRTIEVYYTYRTHVPEFFSNRDVLEKNSQIGLNNACYIGLPGYTEEGIKVYYCRLMDPDVAKFNFATDIKCLFYVQDIQLMEEGSCKGAAFVFDLTHLTFSHIARVGPFTMKKLLFYLQEAMPVRLRSLHFIHPGTLIDALLSIVRPFLHKTTAENLHVHQNLEDIYKYIPKRMLPSDVGGAQDCLKNLHKECVAKVLANKDVIKEEQKMRVDEKRRAGKAQNAGDLFGVEGSFKKLDID